MQILLIEDDRRIADFLVRGLTEEGHRVEHVTDLRGAQARLDHMEIDLLIVDRMLPDGDGLALVRGLRARGDTRPALVLTAMDRVEDRVEGLYGGADDYLNKPFAFEELLARVTALSRRSGGATAGRVTVGDLVVDTTALRVWRAGVEVSLTAQELRLLRVLAENAGRVVSRAKLLDQVWDLKRDPGTNLVDVYISYLRAKIDKGHDRPLLHTVRGVGFLLADDRS
ncbi:response regulator transcription factor [Myxococcota bacterium]|nr:response regulator transcription factor [Myxococcota bacterium]